MATGIVAFQTIIVISLALARLFSVRHMHFVAAAWVVVTLAAVFTSWLLLLQLVTVAVTYLILRPKDPVKEQIVSECPSPSLAPIPVEPRQDAGRDAIDPPESATVRDGPEKARSLTSRLNSYVERQLAIQIATGSLDIALSAERTHVEAALELARSELRLAKELGNDPQKISIYRQAHEEVSAMLGLPRPAPSSPKILAAPDFDIDVDHEDVGTADAIRARVLTLKEQRNEFLDDCLRELRKDSRLKKLFWKKLLELDQPLLADSFVKYANEPRTGQPRSIV